MRTNIVLDDQLIAKALSFSDQKTKIGVIEEALKLMVRIKSQERVKKFRGKLKWEGDLNELRK
ncbi:MAG: type II toxin-antitoxin system VapB family antitoxin [Cyclobacteriaceae bacterium]